MSGTPPPIVGERGGSRRRRLDNFEGAFPLLLLGSVLVVYAGILASQEIGSHASHLPLWGLLAGVGAVIVGAGIYSSFLEPVTTGPSAPSADWVTVPKAEWEARRRTAPPAESSASLARAPPIWWEGPPATSSAPAARTPPASLSARTVRTTTPTAPPPPVRPARPTRDAAPHPTARYSYQELVDELSELEAIVYAGPASSAGPPVSSPPGDRASCADCSRPLTRATVASPCRTCGRGLCAACTGSSKSEDGEIRCVGCRARDR